MVNIFGTTFLTIATLFTACSSLENKKIKILNNGYTGVTILISRKITEDATSQLLLQRLQELFTEASAQLYISTRQHLYFKDITIVVPKTWTKKPEYGSLSGSQYDMAHVVLGQTNDQVGNIPYVFGMTDCGTEAHHIHLVPFFVIRNSPNKGKSIVHQWGHFRWGLFDEYPGSEYPSLSKANLYYNSQGTLKPNVCTDQIKGSFKDSCFARNAKTCVVVNGQPSSGCQFCPDRNSPSQASIMTDYFLDVTTVSQFCDNSSTAGLRHNDKADTKHNRLCNRQSAWEVMLNHPDFQGLKAGPSSLDTTPSFDIVQQDDWKVVLILDISGSMRSDQKLERLVQASSNFLLNIVDAETKVGLVLFNDEAKIECPMTALSSEKIRQQFVNSLPKTATGGTSIGAGLQKGIQCLRNTGETTKGSILFLVSDGKEEDKPYISDVIADVEKAGVVVMSLAFTDRSDIRMVELATNTSGRSFFYSGERDSTVLVDAFYQPVGQSEDSSNVLILIKSMPITVSKTKSFAGDFYIDSSIGKKTAITLSGTSLGGVSIAATSPSGSAFKSNKCGTNVCKLEIPGLSETGQYKFYVTSTSVNTSTIICNVQSYQRTSDAEVISVKSWVSGNSLNVGAKTQIKLFAAVMKGFKPVINAGVEGVLEASMPSIKLRDNGNGADSQENDGIYSAYILPRYVTGNGRINAKIVVNDGNGMASFVVAARRRKRNISPAEDIPLTTSKADKFERTTQTGEFNVLNFDANVEDLLPPSRITTLRINSSDHSSRLFRLQFKAVGDDFDVGKAESYDVRMSEDFDLLTKTPNMASQVKDNVPEPEESGTIQTLPITLPEVGPTYYVGIRAMDAYNNTGDLSNIVSLSVLTDRKWLPVVDSDSVLHCMNRVLIAMCALTVLVLVNVHM